MSKDEAFAWIQEFPGSVTVCDSDGIILAMNDKSIRTFQDSGGAALIGSNLFDCHPEPSRTKVKELLKRRAQQRLHHRKEGNQEADLSVSLVCEGIVSRVCGTVAGNSG